MTVGEQASVLPVADFRSTAREIFLHAINQASVANAFHRHVSYSRGVLRIGDDLHNIDNYSRVVVISFGKAGHTMAHELRQQMGTLISGIVCAPESPDKSQVPGFRYFHGGHPLPNGESVRAANAILKTLNTLDEKSLVIFMISGGGSSMVEKPIDADIAIDELIATHKVLVCSGARIAEINAIRKHLSAVKGGRLAKTAAACRAQQVTIFLSDVPEDALDAVASGPTMPDSSSDEDCYRIAAQYGLVGRFPQSVRELFERRALEETPDKDDPLFHRSRWWSILSNADALKVAAAKAAEAGFAVEIDNACEEWEYTAAADYLLERLRELRKGASRVCLISGGEVTVKLSDSAGVGGRNQQFALYCATKITGENTTVLSAGTDGIDGNSPAAGAVVDGQTLGRLSRLGTGDSVSAALSRFDSYPVFEKLGDGIVTGPTGNNIRDIRILMAY
ncbi:MAG: glycerate 2-kinase [Acidobacteriales bacterium]|nr:glycerate 2-kinase [Terriglobales bacterium]